VEALAAKGEAMIELGESDKEKLLAVYSDIAKYIDVNDNKVFSFMWKLFNRLELQGKALKLAVKHHEDKQNKESDKIVTDILQGLGWEHVVRFLDLSKPAKYPTDYQPF